MKMEFNLKVFTKKRRIYNVTKWEKRHKDNPPTEIKTHEVSQSISSSGSSSKVSCFLCDLQWALQILVEQFTPENQTLIGIF